MRQRNTKMINFEKKNNKELRILETHDKYIYKSLDLFFT